MAKKDGALIVGTIGDEVFYVVNGQQRIRARVPVFNPQTPRQMEVRSNNTELSRTWRDVLTEGQRVAWRQRAKLQGTHGGLLFIKQNFPLIDFGKGLVITPPPMVMPPEMTDITTTILPNGLNLTIFQLIAGTITAQEPFIDFEIAGGFTSVEFSPETGFYEANVNTEAISQGSVHHNSDFRHAFYAADIAIQEPPVEESNVGFLIPSLSTRNIVVRVTRYNKFGNASGKLLFTAVVGPVA